MSCTGMTIEEYTCAWQKCHVHLSATMHLFLTMFEFAILVIGWHMHFSATWHLEWNFNSLTLQNHCALQNIMCIKVYIYLFKACSPMQGPPAHLFTASCVAHCSLHTFLHRTHGSCRCLGPCSLLLLLQKVGYFPISSKNIKGKG